MHRNAILVVLGVAALAAAGPAQAQNLTGDQIMARWGDVPLDATLPNGNKMKLVFRKDGTVDATGAATDQGAWKTVSSGYCTKWKRFNRGEERCFTVMLRSDGGFSVRNVDGSPSAEVAPLR